MRRLSRVLLRFVLPLLFSSALAAGPVITSVSPATGYVAGGQEVTIHGSGFEACSICSPPISPTVHFGGIPAQEVSLVDPSTLIALTPPHLPGTVRVAVSQWNGGETKPDAFTFFGDVPSNFETLLLPVFVRPIKGAFGSEFRTELRGVNNDDALPWIDIYGLRQDCVIVECISLGDDDGQLRLEPGVILGESVFSFYFGTPGRLLYVPKDSLGALSLNLRVYDTSRSATNFGTEIAIRRDPTSAPIRFRCSGCPSTRDSG